MCIDRIILEEQAFTYADYAHGVIDHRRKYTNEPYIYHPVEVANIVRTVTTDIAVIQATYLHDTVEDTNTTEDQIREYFGDDVGDLVEMMTDVSTMNDGNREQRKAIDRKHTSQASPRGKTIKLADCISNTRSIVEYDKKFAVIYLEEKTLLLGVLKEGDETLYAVCQALVSDGIEVLRDCGFIE